MDIFTFVTIVMIVVVFKGMKKFNANAPKRGPVIGTPVRHGQAPRQTEPDPSPFREMTKSMERDWKEMMEQETPPQAPEAGQRPEPRPVLQRDPYAERSDYGASPLDRTQPPAQSPLKTMLDQAFLTGEDLTRISGELPLQDRQARLKTDSQALMARSFAQAFPAANTIARATRPGMHRPIRVRAKGRQNVRHAVLMAEVLARPRAFDL